MLWSLMILELFFVQGAMTVFLIMYAVQDFWAQVGLFFDFL